MSNKRGFVDILSLIGIAFFVTTLAVVVSQIFKTQNIFEKASTGGNCTTAAGVSKCKATEHCVNDVCKSNTVSTTTVNGTLEPVAGNTKLSCNANGGVWCGGCGGFCITGNTQTCDQAANIKCGYVASGVGPTCDANSQGNVVIGNSTTSTYSKCINGRWQDCPTCTIDQLSIVPTYLKPDYDKAIAALIPTSSPTPKPTPSPSPSPTTSPSPTAKATPSPTPKPINICSVLTCSGGLIKAPLAGSSSLCECVKPAPTPVKTPSPTPKATIVAEVTTKDIILKANGTQETCSSNAECISGNCVSFPDGTRHCMSRGITTGYVSQQFPVASTVTQKPTIWQKITAVANGGTTNTTNNNQQPPQQNIIQKTAVNIWDWLNNSNNQQDSSKSTITGSIQTSTKDNSVIEQDGNSVATAKIQKPKVSIFSLLSPSLKNANRPTPQKTYVYYSQKDPQWQSLVGDDIPEKEGVPSIYYDGCGIVTGAMISGDNPKIYYEKMQKYFLDTYGTHYAFNDYGTAYPNHIEVLENVYKCTTVPISGSYAEKKDEIKKYTDHGVPVWINAKIYGSAHHTEAIGVNNDDEIVFNDPYYGEGIAIPDEKIKETDHGWSFTAVICNN